MQQPEFVDMVTLKNKLNSSSRLMKNKDLW